MVTTVEAPTVTVRPLREDDDLDALNAATPLGWQVPMWRELDRSDEVEMHWRVGQLDGEPVALGAVCPMPLAAGGLGPALVTVLPHARRRGVASALRRELEDLARRAVAGVAYAYLVGDEETEAALTAWGLEPTAVHRESALDLTAIDRAEFDRRAHLDGVVIETLPDLAAMDDATWRALHAFVQERFREAPDAADGGGLLPYDVFRQIVQESWMMSTARVDGELVGVTFVVRRPGEGAATNTFFTGVTPVLRGRGIAVGLKCHQALAMADRGVRRLYTQNMVGNEPILAANRTLGFEYALSYADVPVLLDDSTASTSTS